MDVATTHFALNIVWAFFAGALIGIERQFHRREAGLRTNILVATGAALFCSIPVFVSAPGETLRIVAQVVSGIGFLGAGVIMREGLTVKGLDTAATLWCSAAAGSMAGMGLHKEAVVGAGIVLIANGVVRYLVKKSKRLSTEESHS